MHGGLLCHPSQDTPPKHRMRVALGVLKPVVQRQPLLACGKWRLIAECVEADSGLRPAQFLSVPGVELSPAVAATGHNQLGSPA